MGACFCLKCREQHRSICAAPASVLPRHQRKVIRVAYGPHRQANVEMWSIENVDVNKARNVAFEGFVRLGKLFGFESVEVTHTMATQAAIKARAGGFVADEFTGDGQQIINRQQQSFAQLHHHRFLRGRERGLQAVRSVRSIGNTVPAFPFTGSRFADAVLFGKTGHRGASGPHLGANHRRRTCVFVQGQSSWQGSRLDRFSGAKMVYQLSHDLSGHE